MLQKVVVPSGVDSQSQFLKHQPRPYTNFIIFLRTQVLARIVEYMNFFHSSRH